MAEVPPNPPADALPPPRRRHRWLRRLAWLLVALVVLVGISPYVLARAPFRNWLLAALFAQLDGTVRAGGATFDWFRPVALYDLEVLPRGSSRLLLVPVVRGE